MIIPTKRTLYDWILEVSSLIALVFALLPLFFYGDIGEDQLIPIHYNAHGEIDGWGDRSYLWNISLLTALFYAGFTILERYYKKFNYPIEITPDNANSLHRLGVRLMRHLKLLTTLMFAYINLTFFNFAINKEGEGELGMFMPLLLGCMMVVTLVYIVKMIMMKNDNYNL